MNSKNDLASGSSLERVLNHVEAALKAAKFHLGGNRKASLVLFLSALENSRAFLIVRKSTSAFASVSNARSALEALIDARAILKDELHLQRMRQEFLHKKRNVLSARVKMVQHLKLSPIELLAEFQRELNTLDLEIKALDTARVPKKRREELISEHLDDSGVVLILWSVLCDVSHNNINSLAVRHLANSEGNESIILHGPLDPKLAEIIVATLAAMVVDFARELSNFVSANHETYLKSIELAQSELWWVSPTRNRL